MEKLLSCLGEDRYNELVKEIDAYKKTGSKTAMDKIMEILEPISDVPTVVNFINDITNI